MRDGVGPVGRGGAPRWAARWAPPPRLAGAGELGPRPAEPPPGRAVERRKEGLSLRLPERSGISRVHFSNLHRGQILGDVLGAGAGALTVRTEPLTC